MQGLASGVAGTDEIVDVVSLLSETILGLAIGEVAGTVFWEETEERR